MSEGEWTADDYHAAIAKLLPGPDDRDVVAGCAQWLEWVGEANQTVNLTRILEPREAAVKHVYDSLVPRQRLGDAEEILDLGSGPGFPGIPLALALPDTPVRLVESVGKKARFLESAAESLGLWTVSVQASRAEQVLAQQPTDVVVARAVGATSKLLNLLRPVRSKLRRVLLYKGPSGAEELAELDPGVRREWRGELVEQYELPDGVGSRTLLEFRPARKRR